MDFKTLERLWQSEANTRAGVAEAFVLAETMKTLKQRRGRFLLGMIAAGLALAAWTGVVAFANVFRHVTPEREWGAYLMLGIAWVVYINVAARYREHMRAYLDAAASMPETLRALIDENRTAQVRARFIGAATIVFGIALAVAVGQLQAIGKMEPRHALQAGILFGGAMLASAIVQTAIYFRITQPEGKRLKALLDQYAP